MVLYTTPPHSFVDPIGTRRLTAVEAKSFHTEMEWIVSTLRARKWGKGMRGDAVLFGYKKCKDKISFYGPTKKTKTIHGNPLRKPQYRFDAGDPVQGAGEGKTMFVGHHLFYNLGERRSIEQVAIGVWHKDQPGLPKQNHPVQGGDYVLDRVVLIETLVNELVHCVCNRMDISLHVKRQLLFPMTTIKISHSLSVVSVLLSCCFVVLFVFPKGAPLGGLAASF